jgi:Rrf2 family cysteine metabolism transcriptional repressor
VKIQNKTEYGVRALVLLAERAMAKASRDADGFTQTAEPLPLARMAELEGIPAPFLEQILATLRRAGLVESVRGASGGYRLARPPQEITMAEVIRVLEGGLHPIACADPHPDSLAETCERLHTCRSRKVWVKMAESITAALQGLTLQEVAGELSTD